MTDEVRKWEEEDSERSAEEEQDEAGESEYQAGDSPAEEVPDEGEPDDEPASGAPGLAAHERLSAPHDGRPRNAYEYHMVDFWVQLWQGGVAKEYFYLLFAAAVCFFGTLLPWKPLPEIPVPGLASELSGIHFMSGAVIHLFSGLAIVVCLYNIRSRRLLFWPILLLLVINIFTLVVYFMMFEMKISGETYSFIGAVSELWSRSDSFQDKFWDVYRTLGIGVYFVMGGTLFILIQIIASVVKAASKGDEGKPVRKPGAARAGGRRR